jgi:hypothetical protein
MSWFETTRLGLIVIGLLGAGYFCVTWTPRAMKVRGVGGWAMLDTAGWVWAGFVLLVISVVTQAVGSSPAQPDDLLEQVHRLLVIAFIDFIILVRAIRWWNFQRDIAVCQECGAPLSGWRTLRPWRHGPER